MYAGKTKVPLGARIRIVVSEGEPSLLGLTGRATMPHRAGCCEVGWLGVILDEESPYGRKINVHVDEIAIEDGFTALT